MHDHEHAHDEHEMTMPPEEPGGKLLPRCLMRAIVEASAAESFGRCGNPRRICARRRRPLPAARYAEHAARIRHLSAAPQVSPSMAMNPKKTYG